jgi:alkylation response protein AidB-like acyl-CoA dehydrogenase
LKIRKQFNSPIAKFQSLQHRIADMKIALEESRASVHSAISLVASAAGSSLVAVSEAKYIVGKNTSFIAAQGIQLHGAIGLTEEFVIGHYFRAITVFNHLLGTPSAHLRNLASVDDYFDFN